MVDAIRAVYNGQSLLDPEVAKVLVEHLKGKEVSRGEVELLTEQELRILRLIAEGKTNKEIATAIFLSEKTVRNYVSNILSKLNLGNRSQAVAWAIRNKLV